MQSANGNSKDSRENLQRRQRMEQNPSGHAPNAGNRRRINGAAGHPTARRGLQNGNSQHTRRDAGVQSRQEKMRNPHVYVQRGSGKAAAAGKRRRADVSLIAVLCLAVVAVVEMVAIFCVALSGGFGEKSPFHGNETDVGTGTGTVYGEQSDSSADQADTAETDRQQTTPETAAVTTGTVPVGPSGTHDGPPIVLVDPGHGFADGGSVSDFIDPLSEMDINLSIALKLKTALEKAGFEVIMTHESNEIPAGKPSGYLFNKYARRDMLEGLDYVDFFVSIHCNSFGDEAVNGTRMYYSTGNSDKISKYAQKIADAIYRLLPDKEPRLYPMEPKDAYVVVNTQKCPAILVEVGFITNKKDAENMLDESWQEKMAEGIAQGIVSCLVN